MFQQQVPILSFICLYFFIEIHLKHLIKLFYTPFQVVLHHGSLKSMHVIGSIQSIPDILLKGIFYVPYFNHNLL